MDDILDEQVRSQGHDCNVPKATSTLSGDAYVSGQDHLLPVANVGRIMKKALPSNAKISKQAKETMQECASEFIGFITGEAANRCHKDNRKTINGDDICSAMTTLGLDDYADATRRYLNRYKEQEEKATSMNLNNITKINVLDELSISRSCSSGRQLFPMNPSKG